VGLAWPLLFTDANFDTDWLLHLWYLWHQSLTISANGYPSLFINYSHAVFYPEYAFYGGTIYALGGALSLLLGDAPLQTYILTYCIGFAAAYGSWYWLARMAGLGRWQAHAPGFVFVTSASYLTIVYGRGDWQEFIAVSTIPLMAAAGLSVLFAERLRTWPGLALLGSGIVFFGGHNMTMLWGSTFLAAVGLVVVVCVPEARRAITGRGALRVVVLLGPAVLLSAWFVLPAVAYESHTLIGSGFQSGERFWEAALRKYTFTVDAQRLFTLSRASSEPNSYLDLSLPIAAMAWVLVGAAMLMRTRSVGPWKRILMIACGATTVALLVMTHVGLILALPRPYAVLEFSYRLESYVLLGLSSAILAALALFNRSDAGRVALWRWALAPALLVSAVGAVEQLAALPTHGARYAMLRSYSQPLPPGFTKATALQDYDDIHQLSLSSHQRRPAAVYFPPSAVHDDRISEVVHFIPGELVDSNVGAGPELVRVTGARIVGLDPHGDDVLEIDRRSRAASRRGSLAPTETISLSPAHTLPVTVGRVAALVGAVLILAELVALAGRGLLPGSSAPRAGGTPSFPARGAGRRAGSSRRSNRS
jgi:hypothetical protein